MVGKRRKLYVNSTDAVFDGTEVRSTSCCSRQHTVAATGQFCSTPVPARAAKKQLTQPLKWHGGKHYLAQRIIGLMPEHTHYAEPFAGGLAVLLQKDPYGISEAVNDLHSELIELLAGAGKTANYSKHFYRRLECTPLSQTLFDAAASQTGSAVDRAVQFFIRARQSRQGLQRDYTTPTTRTRRGMNEQVSAWLTAVAGLPEIHQRLLRVEIRNLAGCRVHPQVRSSGLLFLLRSALSAQHP